MSDKNKSQELNPNHPTLQQLSEHWQRIAALLVFKVGGEITITTQDIKAATEAGLFLTVDGRKDDIKLKLVDEKTAHILAEKEGGLPH